MTNLINSLSLIKARINSITLFSANPIPSDACFANRRPLQSSLSPHNSITFPSPKMGTTISKLAERFLKKSALRILMVGLDASGKTTILYKLKLGEIVATMPTIGFNVETVEYRKVNFNIWDVGGQDKIRPLWRHYLQKIQGIIFVVDSADKERIAEARSELHQSLSKMEPCNAALLVYANKQDLPNAMRASEVADKLNLHSLGNRRWFIQSASATSGEGLYEGLDWLHNSIANNGSKDQLPSGPMG